MYKSFYGLSKMPFTTSPDPGLLFLTTQHSEVLAGLVYGLLNRKGFLMLTGEAGTGKTTLLARVLEYLPASRLHASAVLHPTLTTNEFLEMLMLDFGISNIPDSKARRLVLLQKFLLDTYRQGRIAALIVDEAHKLSVDALEEVRLLGNLDFENQKLLQIVLSGQPELAHTMARADMQQLKQRISVRLALKRISSAEVAEYVRYRWERAGGGADSPFTGDAIAAVAEWSGGTPRLVNTVCDTALLMAFAEESRSVERSHIAEAVSHLDISESNNGGRRRFEHSPATPVPVRTAVVTSKKVTPANSRVSLWTRCATKLGMAQ